MWILRNLTEDHGGGEGGKKLQRGKEEKVQKREGSSRLDEVKVKEVVVGQRSWVGR